MSERIYVPGHNYPVVINLREPKWFFQQTPAPRGAMSIDEMDAYISHRIRCPGCGLIHREMVKVSADEERYVSDPMRTVIADLNPRPTS